MLTIHGLTVSSNTTKTTYVAEALGLDYHYVSVDLLKGEQKTPEHLKRHPLGKVPTLTHDDFVLFESNAICLYLAKLGDTPLYPKGNLQQEMKVKQWLDFFSNHPGRWLAAYAFETVFKPAMNIGEPDAEKIKEAEGFLAEQLPVIEQELSKGQWLCGEQSIADYVAFAYLENSEIANFDLSAYPNIVDWYGRVKETGVIGRAKTKMDA